MDAIPANRPGSESPAPAGGIPGPRGIFLLGRVGRGKALQMKRLIAGQLTASPGGGNEGSLEPDAAARLQEGHTLLIGAPGRGKTVLLSNLVRDAGAARGVPVGLDEDGSTLYWLPERPQLQSPSIFMAPELLEELRNSRMSFTYRIPGERGGGISAGLSTDHDLADPHHTNES